jgi:diguanylate cyclase (GGDEF)-like protein
MQSKECAEANRVAALRSLSLLDTPPQASFDRITRFCAELFDCSVALISLVDANRQWFLARSGVNVCETTRDISFCSHAIEMGRTLLVTDALEDGRFKDNSLVTAGPRIRSYLGVPISDPDGNLLGTLCVADSRPQHFDERHREQLVYFAKSVEDLIEAHCQRVEASYLAAHLGERSDRLEKSVRIFAQAEKVARMGSWELDLATQRLTYSDESYAILDLERGPQIDFESAMEMYVAEDRPVIERALKMVVATHGRSDVEAHLTTPLGTRKRVKLMGEYLQPSNGQPAKVVGIVQDITEAYHSRAALERAADYDSLTNLLNRQAFDRLLGQQLKTHRKSGSDFFVLMLDLDGFKDINDTFGHLVGDMVLEEISARISGAVPSDAVIARWGGDEFAVITPMGISQEDVSSIGEKLIQAISKDVEIAGRKVAVSATCGFARSGEAVVARELLRRADLALYHGKAREPGRTHEYRTSLERDNRLRQEAISLVRSAINEDRLFAGYQPIIHLPTNALVGFEALMRLSTRSGEKLTATQVLPAILDPILSREVSDRMSELVCADFPAIQVAQPDAQFISLNATEADLLSRDYSDRLLATLRAGKVQPKNVTLEVTETMLLVNDSAAVQAVLTKLRNAGMQIALDDFGTGFSSLSHLRDFPIDKVKIDGSFVQKICSDHQSRLIVQALIAMAKNLGKEVIAEGIETDEQRKLLLQMGCYYGQGYLFSPAETACRLKTLRLGGSKAAAVTSIAA